VSDAERADGCASACPVFVISGTGAPAAVGVAGTVTSTVGARTDSGSAAARVAASETTES
jgi:hypothetical protein